ncbi:VOC family protein [Maribacter sp. MMG018]|uniref:VOC family protein n=1 Tax=Maribacter sp. MMG018 TaxID=2822688 RepID=UPI001B37FF64|nr:VOC family protein [Maribacter sp. MMG018]MBQ4913285.1 VOC family protein [Maribacter sp. MMG018]
MKIEHIAIWVKDLELMRNFYEKYFNAIAGELYHNPQKEFTSYFLGFKEGVRLELMHKPTVFKSLEGSSDLLGLAHFAISVGTKEKVDALTEQLRNDGFTVEGNPRTTGDGYYESIILDPEANRIEITI